MQNEAFQTVLDKLGAQANSLATNKELVAALLTYHVTAGAGQRPWSGCRRVPWGVQLAVPLRSKLWLGPALQPRSPRARSRTAQW